MEQEQRFTFIDGLKEIWKQKITALIVLVASGLIIFLALFIYGRMTATAKSEFTMTFVGASSNTYPDGTLFDYNTMVSKERVDAVKASDQKYNSIDVEKIFEENAISIKRIIYTEENAIDFSTIGNTYVIKIGFSYFTDKELAQAFIDDLINLQLDEVSKRSNSNLVDYISPLENSEFEYQNYINAMSNQYNAIISGYNSIVSSNGTTITTDGVIIKNKIEDIKAQFLGGSIFNILTNEVITNKYLRNIESSDRIIKAQIDSLNRQKELVLLNIADLETTLADLPTSIFTADDLIANIASLKITLNNINNELIQLNAMLNGISAPKDFRDEIKYYYDLLSDLSSEYATNYSFILSQNQTYNYIGENGPVEILKPVSSIIALLIAGIGAIAISLVVVYIRYGFKKDKEIKLALEQPMNNDKA
ncbi:hypothetical protein LJC17_00300 [Acholeplasma sp. OttesenSCG-928-E16]|nr:hypothetical protein [Acholeplasma sp. OttesenSCG-928-E16]